MEKVKLLIWFDGRGFFVIIVDCHNIFSLIFVFFYSANYWYQTNPQIDLVPIANTYGQNT
jgi:ABC-type uncharacterized transport system YnjBCD permease subunit